jgi:hypothetical protein
MSKINLKNFSDENSTKNVKLEKISVVFKYFLNENHIFVFQIEI